MKIKKSFYLMILCLFEITSSCCKLQQDFTPEFTVSNLEVKKGFDENACMFGGVYFDFFNKSQKQIVSMDLNIRLFDALTGETAFPGILTIKTSFDGLIDKLENRQMCVSLDDYITFDSQNDFLIDAFIISRIKYSDGSVWNDYFGLYGIYSIF